MSLPLDQFFTFHKVDKSFMISKDLYRGFSTLQIRLSIFKTTDDCQQLLDIDLIIVFCRHKVFIKEGHKMQQAIISILR